MNRKTAQTLKWLGFLMFAIAFAVNQAWLTMPWLVSWVAPYDIWIMIGAALIAFLLGNPMRWLGTAIFVFGYALLQNWINLNLQGITLDALWVMMGGYLTLFFNSRY